MNTQNERDFRTVKTYWLLDGDNKTFVLRDKIKQWGGYWVPEHKSWCIDNPSETMLEAIKLNGISIQFRRHKSG